MGKIKVRTPREVFGSVKKNYNNPIFVEGFLFGAFALSLFGIIISLT